MTLPNLNTSNKDLPQTIALDKWADLGFNWQGVITTDDLPRLNKLLKKPSRLNVSVKLYKKSSVLRLDYGLDGELIVACDRCLADMAFVPPDTLAIAILQSQSQIFQVGDDDYIMLDELDDPRFLPIGKMLEDELILSLPTTITHDDCQMAVQFVEEPKENPFAVLSALKDKL